MRRDLLAEIEHDSSDSAPAWMVSYGDLMSLLLTLFVMLVSMSEIKQNDKFQGVADSLHEQFSLNQPATGGLPGELAPRSAPLAVLAVSGREARRRVMQPPGRQAAIADNSESSRRIVPASREATTAGAIGFAPLTSELSAEALERLREIAESIAGMPHIVEVRGLADPSGDLDLAWQRARTTAKHLIDQHSIETERVRITVAAQPASIAISGPADASEKPMVEVVLLEEATARIAGRPTPDP
jgi:chemotaxis protein MotB